MATATSEFWAPPAALLDRRGIVARIGPWHSGLPIIQDARFLYDAASHGARFVHVPGIGAQYRVAPSSLSRKNHRGFIADCAVNAQEIETAWRQRGALSEARSKALAGVWAQVATSALLHGLDEFEPARRGYNRSARRRLLFEAGCLARVAIGAARAATLARGLLQLKASAHSIIRLFGTQ
jgi:hypothetical protein